MCWRSQTQFWPPLPHCWSQDADTGSWGTSSLFGLPLMGLLLRELENTTDSQHLLFFKTVTKEASLAVFVTRMEREIVKKPSGQAGVSWKRESVPPTQRHWDLPLPVFWGVSSRYWEHFSASPWVQIYFGNSHIYSRSSLALNCEIL